jgi:hypothetical protein
MMMLLLSFLLMLMVLRHSQDVVVIRDGYMLSSSQRPTAYRSMAEVRRNEIEAFISLKLLSDSTPSIFSNDFAANVSALRLEDWISDGHEERIDRNLPFIVFAHSLLTVDKSSSKVFVRIA